MGLIQQVVLKSQLKPELSKQLLLSTHLVEESTIIHTP